MWHYWHNTCFLLTHPYIFTNCRTLFVHLSTLCGVCITTASGNIGRNSFLKLHAREVQHGIAPGERLAEGMRCSCKCSVLKVIARNLRVTQLREHGLPVVGLLAEHFQSVFQPVRSGFRMATSWECSELSWHVYSAGRHNRSHIF